MYLQRVNNFYENSCTICCQFVSLDPRWTHNLKPQGDGFNNLLSREGKE